jgi:hypothetical protein
MENDLTESITTTLVEFLGFVKSKKQELDEPIKEKADILVTALGAMSTTEFNDAPMTIKEMGGNLIDIISKDESISSKLDYTIFFIAQVMIERAMRTDAIQTGGPDRLLDWVLTRANAGSNIDYMQRASLGGVLLKSIAHDSSAINKQFEDIKAKSSELLKNSQKTLDGQEKEAKKKASEFDTNVTNIDSRLDEYIRQVKGLQGELSFLVLGKAFTTFITEKAKEKSRLFFALLLLGIIIVSAPLVVFINGFQVSNTSPLVGESVGSKVAKSGKGNEPNKKILATDKYEINSIISRVIYLIPVTVAEIILIFYFRILLGQFNSVNAQLLQLKMRLSLCQFIESYVEFKKDSGDHDLEKFESLIFSNLMPSAEQVPSTFDGIDQLSKLLGSLGKK